MTGRIPLQLGIARYDASIPYPRSDGEEEVDSRPATDEGHGRGALGKKRIYFVFASPQNQLPSSRGRARATTSLLSRTGLPAGFLVEFHPAISL